MHIEMHQSLGSFSQSTKLTDYEITGWDPKMGVSPILSLGAAPVVHKGQETTHEQQGLQGREKSVKNCGNPPLMLAEVLLGSQATKIISKKPKMTKGKSRYYLGLVVRRRFNTVRRRDI